MLSTIPYKVINCCFVFAGRGIKGDNSDSQGHGITLGSPVRHDHHQQWHPTCVHTIASRNQQPGARAAMGARPLAEAHLAGHYSLWHLNQSPHTIPSCNVQEKETKIIATPGTNGRYAGVIDTHNCYNWIQQTLREPHWVKKCTFGALQKVRSCYS